MAAKDCLFTIAFIMGFLLSVAYIVLFANESWTTYTLFIGVHEEEGRFGLWKKCTFNTTSAVSKCSHTDLLKGPGFLEASRTMACFGIVFVVGGIIGYIISDGRKNTKSCKEKVLYRLQEACYMLAGILGVQASSVYLRNHKSYYKDRLGTEDVEDGGATIAMLVVSILLWVNSILLWCTRPCPVPPTKEPEKTNTKPKEPEKKNEADSRKRWLSSNAIPTPVEQKEKMDLTPTQKTHGGTNGQETKTDTVDVKKGWSRSIVAPTQVILAIKRMKKGEKRNDAEKGQSTIVVQGETEPPKEDPNNKFKGIFTVVVENKTKEKSGPAPPAPPPILATPRRRVDSTSSSSSSSSSISVEAAHGVNKPAKTGKGGVSMARPTPVVRHFSQGEAQIRARAQQGAVVVTDDASVKVAQEKARPGLSKRHLTHQESSLRNTVSEATSSDGNRLNIYHIADEPGAHALPPPPNYEDVMKK